jgi:acyl-homoserine-lactone acylase
MNKYYQKSKKIKKRIVLILGLIFTLCVMIKIPVVGATKTEILWDTWGVPHIEAKDNQA